MSDAERTQDKSAPSTPSGGSRIKRWMEHAALAVAVLLLGYIAYRMALAFLPRWWAQQIAQRVDGSFTQGAWWGLFYGFVFTVVPLLLLAQTRRRFISWPWKGAVALVAVVLATPNWLTLSVVLGSSRAAHAGERILDVDGPGFRAASAIGAGAAVLVAVAVISASMLAARRRRQVKDLRRQLDERERRDRETPAED
ncbi:MAG: hypothetical protein QM621_06755 [Aeromicrobium sp.]|uniref:hypothetical protein n=1 Tax=Aeromicrobium sp. TaxID=1871063 RepID=UPI0039E5D20B